MNAYSYAQLATADKHRAIVAVVRIGTLERTAVFHKYDYSGTWVCSANPGYKADQIQAWTYEDEFIRGLTTALYYRQVTKDPIGKGGIAAIIGKWPGNETDEEINAMLKKID